MKNLDRMTLLLFVFVLIFTAISISIYTNKILEPTLHNNQIKAEYERNKRIENDEPEEEEIVVKEQTEEERILELKSTSETNRIHRYFSEYINLIDLKEYEKAYSYLYPEFKDNYFPEFDSFKKYVQELYPEFIGIQYKDIERQGSYYILTIHFYDALAEGFNEFHEQKFVIYEKDFGEFVLSFQVWE